MKIDRQSENYRATLICIHIIHIRGVRFGRVLIVGKWHIPMLPPPVSSLPPPAIKLDGVFSFINVIVRHSFYDWSGAGETAETRRTIGGEDDAQLLSEFITSVGIASIRPRENGKAISVKSGKKSDFRATLTRARPDVENSIIFDYNIERTFGVNSMNTN